MKYDMTRLLKKLLVIPNFFKKIFKGRALSRAKSRRNLDYSTVLAALEEKGISIRVASPKMVMEEVRSHKANHCSKMHFIRL